MKKKSEADRESPNGGDSTKWFFPFLFLFLFVLLSSISLAMDASALKQEAITSEIPSFPGALRIVIEKSARTLTLYKENRPFKMYRAAFGRGYMDGDKRRKGDMRTPEGDFYICTMNTSKRFYKFLGLSYPGSKHAEYGLQSGVISPNEYALIKKAVEKRQPPPWNTPLGGAVGIHGRMQVKSMTDQPLAGGNWTYGCIALSNSDIDELYRVVSLGTPVTILP
jgi:murein L,D-transpeptidase YafK